LYVQLCRNRLSPHHLKRRREVLSIRRVVGPESGDRLVEGNTLDFRVNRAYGDSSIKYDEHDPVLINVAHFFTDGDHFSHQLNNNWRQFQNIAYADWVLYLINILFLSFVVLVPFATTVWANYPDTTAGVLFFDCIMFITGLVLYVN
jgi:hypothetical protein